MTLGVRFVEKKRQTLVRITPDGRKYGLTIPLSQAEALTDASIGEGTGEQKAGEMIITADQGGATIRYKNGRPLKTTQAELRELQEQLGKRLYYTLILDGKVFITIPKPHDWATTFDKRALILTNLNRTATIRITPYYLPANAPIISPMVNPDRRREKITPNYARRVRRHRYAQGLLRTTSSRHPLQEKDLMVMTEAWSVSKEAKRTAAAQDRIVRRMEVHFR